MSDLTKPQYEHGFWWWYDPTRRGWFVGCAPAFGRPSWASSQSGMAYTALKEPT